MDRRLQDNLTGKQHNYLAPFFWLHGEEDSLILDQLQRIYESGSRSVCLESRVHQDFCREGWWSDVRLIMEECRKKGMQVWILDDKRFPSGQANGIFAEKYKDLRAWGFAEYHLDVSGPVTDGCAMAECWLTGEEDEFLRVLACRHIPDTESYSEVLDITDGLHEGMVYFTLPEGLWRIVFIVKTRSGIADFLLPYCDILNPTTVQLYIDEVFQSHYDHFSEYFGNTFLGFFSDEPCFRNNSRYTTAPDMGEPFHHYPWSQGVMDKLQEKYGDDAWKMMAGIWFDVETEELGDVSEQIRYAYMDIITEEYRNNYCNQIADWCHAHGVQYIGHIIEDHNIHSKTGNGPGHYFRALDHMDMAGIDVVLSQIVPGLTQCSHAASTRGSMRHKQNKFYNYYLAKLGSSMAHMDPLKKGRAMCEIFGAYGWAEGTRIMKALADHMLVRGINYYVPHAFSAKPNDPDCPPNFYDTGANAQYKYFGLLMDYMNRASYLLSDGIHVPMAAILYDGEAHWINKARVPLEEIGKELYDNLLDYDVIPADYLDQIDERGMINGETYPCLLVPCYEGMPECIRTKLARIKIPVIYVTKEGVCAPELAEKYCGQGIYVDISELADFIKKEVGRDVDSDYEGIFLRYYHYTRDGAHIYMFSNEDIHQTIRANVTLSAFAGGNYIVYDAFENHAYEAASETGSITLELPPYHTIMFLCGEVSWENVSKGSCVITGTDILADERLKVAGERILQPVFQISYAKEDVSTYTPYKTTDQLFNVTGYQELPAFSGNIKYEGEFEVTDEIAPGDTYLLDLGYVGEACAVCVNDIMVGRKITQPYVFDISGAIKQGTNMLTVIVSNHNGFAYRDRFSMFLLFEPSGLLGPIKLKKLIVQ